MGWIQTLEVAFSLQTNEVCYAAYLLEHPPCWWCLKMRTSLEQSQDGKQCKRRVHQHTNHRTTAQSPMSFLASAQQILCLRAWIFKWVSMLCGRRVWSFPWSCQAAVWKLCSLTAVVLWVQRHYGCSSSLFEQLTPKAETKNLAPDSLIAESGE